MIGNIISNIMGDKLIYLIDIGADGGLQSNWRKISKNIYAICFEPNLVSNGNDDNNSRWFKKALGSAKENKIYYLCRDNQKSSNYIPNIKFLNRFPNIGRFFVEQEINMETDTLDSVLINEKLDIDFIKLDTQGSELEILQGGRSNLEKNVLGMEVEVSFFHVYEQQPLFDDVKNYLSDAGFEFIDFTNLTRWERTTFSGFGQLIFGDALFLRSPEVVLTLVNELDDAERDRKILAYISICILYDKLDLLKVFVDSIDFDLDLDINAIVKKMDNRRKTILFVNKIISKIISKFNCTHYLLPK